MTFDPNGKLNASEVRSRTDVMFQDFSVYIEGVQVPFMYLSVQSSLGNLPRMSLQVPSQKGLMEICRYYEPKVHVFFKDPVTGNDCLFFSGVITSNSYFKSTSTPPRKGITFNCEHRYVQMNLVTLDYSGYVSDANPVTDSNPNEAAVKVNLFNSLQSIGMALTGVDPNKVGGSEEISIANINAKKKEGNQGNKYPYNAIPASLADVKYRLTGFPGVPLNLWNQLKAQTYEYYQRYEAMTRMYIPLVEDGLQFFRRLGGHYLVESKLNDSRTDPCIENSTGENALETNPRLVPPAHKQLMRSAVQADISTQIIYTMGQFSGEFTSFLKILQNLVFAIEYDMVILNSPAEVVKDPRKVAVGAPSEAMDVIIKPQMPHYYAPACNVVLPQMLDSLSINQDEQAVPTRITATNDNIPSSEGKFGINYRAPQSVREAIARGIAELNQTGTYYSNLRDTTAAAQFKVGKYEQGRGIRHQRFQIPNWLAMMAESQSNASGSEVPPDSNSQDGYDIEKFRKAWQYRYDPEGKMKQLNPWDAAAGISDYQRMLFSAADSRFTTETAKARTGTVSMIFNPYMVVGYPMDIIDPTPEEPSFHAFCIDITHTISSSTIGTQASFVSAISYEELGNYEQHYVHPWLEAATNTLSEEETDTGTIYRSSIVNNVTARKSASEFYKSTLGVGAAAPEMLYDFSDGQAYPYARLDGDLTLPDAESFNMHSSGEGNLGLVYRPIETKQDVETRFGIKFIDMSPGNYDPVAFSYQAPILDEPKLMEPGESMFLDYTDIPAPSKEELKAGGT